MNQLHSCCGVVYGFIKAMQISTSTSSLKEYIFFQFGHTANSDFEYFNCLKTLEGPYTTIFTSVYGL